MRFLTVLGRIYAVACLISLVLIAVSSLGLFGMDEDPLSAVFAVMLAWPWSAWMTGFESGSPVAGMAVLAGGMILNLAIIFGVARFLRSRVS